MAFPQDVNYIINKLRDEYMKSSENEVSKRMMKPYLLHSQYHESNLTSPQGIHNDLDGMNLRILSENRDFISSLYSNAESPPIQSNFYQNFGNRLKKYQTNESEEDSDKNSVNTFDSGPENPGGKKSINFSLQTKESDMYLNDSKDDSKPVGAQKPPLEQKFSNIKEETEDEENELGSHSTITPLKSTMKFQPLKKSTYRTSLGKFFTKGTTKNRNDSEESDSSDDEAEEEDKDNVTTSTVSSDDELIVDDKDERVFSKEDEDFNKIDHENSNHASPNGSISNGEDSLIDDSFTDNDGDSVEDVAWERAQLQWNLNKSIPFENITASDNSGAPDVSVDVSDFSQEVKSMIPKRPRHNSDSNEMLPKVRTPSKTSHSVSSTTGLGSVTSLGKKESDGLVFSKLDSDVWKSSTNDKVSKLSALLNDSKKADTSPLETFSSISGENLNNRVASSITVYVSCSMKFKDTPLKIKVKKTGRVFELIGYILLKLSELEPETTKADNKFSNPNKWKLQVSDEGEIFEEDFGVLDRTQLVSKSNPDEVSLIEVDDETSEKYKTLTPWEHSLDAGDSKLLPVASNNSTILARRISKFNNSDLNLSENKPIQLRIFKYPENKSYDNVWFTTNDTVQVVLNKYCQMKNLNVKDYCIQINNANFILDLKDILGKLKDRVDLLVLPNLVAEELEYSTKPLDNKVESISRLEDSLKVATDIAPPKRTNSGVFSSGLGGLFPPRSLNSPSSYKKNSSKLSSSLTKTKNRLKHGKHSNHDFPPEPFSAPRLKSYNVWRRQQVNFMNKHERVLTFDGDYVYISPTETTAHHVLKTSNFHVSQVVQVKQSRKYPANFKIFIKRKNSADIKRYDFEAQSVEISHEIVAHLQAIIDTYKMNNK